MSADQILFRCSSLGHLMTEPKSKSDKESGELADTVKTHLIDVFLSHQYSRREEITSKYLDKGNAREEDSITLLVQNDKRMFRKNGKRLKNEFITGEPDLFIGEYIDKADETIDIKSSWSAHTFFRTQYKDTDKMNLWQGHGYMALTGAKKHTIAYCLVNGTADAIQDEKRKLSYRRGMLSISGNESEEYKQQCRQIEINHIFDIESFKKENPGFDFHSYLENWTYDISFEKRLFKIVVDRDEAKIEALYKRITQARNWLNQNLY